jgi:hypothetical protein
LQPVACNIGNTYCLLWSVARRFLHSACRAVYEQTTATQQANCSRSLFLISSRTQPPDFDNFTTFPCQSADHLRQLIGELNCLALHPRSYVKQGKRTHTHTQQTQPHRKAATRTHADLRATGCTQKGPQGAHTRKVFAGAAIMGQEHLRLNTHAHCY